MSDLTATQPGSASGLGPRPERLVPAIGGFIALLGVVGLLDDLDIVRTSPWLAVIAFAVAGGLALVVRTVRRLATAASS